MKIAVLSGKGGTGKTLVSVNLAAVAEKSVYMDYDVEEPNGHLFFKPVGDKTKNIYVRLPVVDSTLCNGCRICADFCRYNALAYTGKSLLVFEDVCHNCGGCVLFCPNNALKEEKRAIGQIHDGQSGNVRIVSGIMDIGVASGVPIIKELARIGSEAGKLTLVDCPPGSGCIVMESIKDADYCVIVAEPTIFGAHNLNMVYELVKLFKKPHGVVLNKCQEGDNPSESFCKAKRINILGKISYDNELGSLNSKALIAARENLEYRDLFTSLLQKIIGEVRHEAVVNP